MAADSEISDDSSLVDERLTKALYPKGKRVEGYSTDIITDNCIDWLETHNQDQPFLLMCHFKAPHDDFEYHPRYEHIFDGIEIPEPESLWEDKAHRSDGSRSYGTTVSEKNMRRNAVRTMSAPDYPTGQLHIKNLDETERTKAAYQKYLKDYLRVVKGIDDSVGRLLDVLEQKGLLEETLVIYTSDQGMFLGEHDYIDKRWIYEEALKMPFVARLPSQIPQGLVLDSVISNVDFADTLLDFVGLPPMQQSQGRSFRRLLTGDEEQISSWVDISYNRYWMHMAHHDNPAHYGIRTKRYKLIYFYGHPLDAVDAEQFTTPTGWELYDFVCDPDEIKNVYDAPEYQDVVQEMKILLRDFKDSIGDSDLRYPELTSLDDNLYYQEVN